MDADSKGRGETLLNFYAAHHDQRPVRNAVPFLPARTCASGRKAPTIARHSNAKHDPQVRPRSRGDTLRQKLSDLEIWRNDLHISCKTGESKRIPSPVAGQKLNRKSLPKESHRGGWG